MKTNLHATHLVDVREEGPVTVVSIRIPTLTDAEWICAVANEVRTISARSESPNILLDFHRVEHLSLDFLDAMKEVVQEIEMRGGTISCCSLRHEMRAVLRILGADVSYAGNNQKHALARYLAHIQKKNGTRPAGVALAPNGERRRRNE